MNVAHALERKPAVKDHDGRPQAPEMLKAPGRGTVRSTLAKLPTNGISNIFG